MVREEGGGGRARRAVDCAVDAPLDARFGVPRGMCRWVWMVVRFVCLCVIRVPVWCARVSRVCPGSPRCLFSGTVSLNRCPVCPVCVPTPPGVFLPVPRGGNCSRRAVRMAVRLNLAPKHVA